jgi:hypothetical protein
VEYVQAEEDALANAVSSAMETIEANGYNPNGVVLARDSGAALRNARDGDGRRCTRTASPPPRTACTGCRW